MKNLIRLFFFVLPVLFCIVNVQAESGDSVRVEPMDNQKALRNPGMGWVFHHFDNSISAYGEWLGPNYDGREFPGLTVAYLRLAWSFLEPQEGVYNWSVLDSVIQRYRRMNIRYAFRFTAFEGNDNTDGVPKWLRDAGCPGFMAEPYGKKYWEVDYSAPLFLEKLENFLAAFSKRYASDPYLEFVDIGTIGIWGEGHPCAKKYDVSVLIKHIDLHKKYFPKKYLAANDDFCMWFKKPGMKEVNDPEVMRMLLDKGLALRDDSLNVFKDPKFHYNAEMAGYFWRSSPVILEMGHYEHAKKVGAWDDTRYLKAIREYHGSYASIHGNPIVFLKENKEQIAKINLILGYRFQLIGAQWKKTVKRSDCLEIDSEWTNAGVARCFSDEYPSWTLINQKGDLCAVFADDSFNFKSLLPGEKKKLAGRFLITPKLAKGKYTLCVSVGSVQGTPEIALPYDSCSERKMFEREFPEGVKNESDCRRYPLGEIEIQ